MGDIDFKVISAAEKSNKFPKKPVFGRKNQLRTSSHLGQMAQATLVMNNGVGWFYKVNIVGSFK